MPIRPAQILLLQTLQNLDEWGDEQFGAGASGFFKEAVKARGVRSPLLIGLSAELYREIKPWPVKERDWFITGLWKDGHIETGALACYTYRRFEKSFGEREFRLFEHWLQSYVGNWAHCDGLSMYLLAAAIANVPELAQELRGWTKAKSPWKRRAAAVALVNEAKRGRHLDLVLEIAQLLASHPEDLVQKGAGWLLKEAYPAHPRAVVEFLGSQAIGWPRLVLRYAAEKMTAADKCAVLGIGTLLRP